MKKIWTVLAVTAGLMLGVKIFAPETWSQGVAEMQPVINKFNEAVSPDTKTNKQNKEDEEHRFWKPVGGKPSWDPS